MLMNKHIAVQLMINEHMGFGQFNVRIVLPDYIAYTFRQHPYE